MVEIIAIVIGLWLLGIIKIPWLTMPHFPVLSILGYSLTIERLLIFGIVIWLAMSLGSPFRQMIWVFFILWLLSILGIVIVGGIGMLILISIVVGLILSAVQK
jgi:hypothetical protein